jgi:predicted TIM-barrel fold metal-dependent hydrolase
MFLKQVSGLAVLATSRAVLGEEKPKEQVFPIIDTHQHLWDLQKFRLPWLKGQNKLNKSFLPEDYRKAAAELANDSSKVNVPPARVVKTVYMEVDVTPAQQQAEAEYVTAICKRGKTPMVAAVISGRPASEGFARYIGRFKNSPYIKGVRQVLHGPQTPAGYCLDRNFIRGIRLLGELGMSFDLCMRPAELGDAAKLVDACPDTRFILDHCGNANVQAKDRTQWKKDMAALGKRKNLVCKVSGIVASAKPGAWSADDLAPIVNHTLDSFGPDRVLFGGDWPVCTLAASLAQWVTALRTIVRQRKAQEQRKLFHDNAVRVYRLG